VPVRLVALVCAATLAAVGVPAGLVDATAARAAKCTPHNLAATPAVKTALRRAHHRVTPSDTGPRAGSVYYGTCGGTRWAMASFRHRNGGFDDQPESFKRVRGGRWRDLGDDGACQAIPAQLRALWGTFCP
jgi:hypothetical protein